MNKYISTEYILSPNQIDDICYQICIKLQWISPDKYNNIEIFKNEILYNTNTTSVKNNNDNNIIIGDKSDASTIVTRNKIVDIYNSIKSHPCKYFLNEKPAIYKYQIKIE